MTTREQTVSLNLSPVLPLLNEFNRGKLIGIGEGLAMALENAPVPVTSQPNDAEKQCERAS